MTIMQNAGRRRILASLAMASLGFATISYSATTAFTPLHNPGEKRSYVLSPLLSAFLPGFDQWWEGQYEYAATYTSIAAASTVYGTYNLLPLEDTHNSDAYQALSQEQKQDRTLHDELERKVQLSFQLSGGPVTLGLGAMSSLSAYQSFRTAVTTRYRYGQFGFLDPKVAESPQELALAPFRFDFLQRTTSWAPLAIVGTFFVINANQTYPVTEHYEKHRLNSSDYFYSTSTAYLAGVHEEALFRGFFMPCLMEWTGSPFWSNSIDAVVFAAAHMNNVPVPVAQLALGWYLGWVSQRNQWTLSEGIFIHAWWDVFSLLSSYSSQYKTTNGMLPIVWLPPLRVVF